MAAKKKKSTTRSGTNLESLKDHTFFLDRALESYALRDALKQLGARVEMHRDYFEEGADDPDWLPEVAKQGWIILSTDQFNYLEREAIRNAGGRAFLLMQGSMKGDETSRNNHWRDATHVADTQINASAFYRPNLSRQKSTYFVSGIPAILLNFKVVS
jgi:hypothetical protein